MKTTESRQEEVIELEIKDIITIAIVIGVAGIVMSYTTQIQSNVALPFAQQSCAALGSGYTYNVSSGGCSNATTQAALSGNLPYNVSVYGMQGNLNLSAQLPTIGTIAGAAIIITILIRYFFVM
jgi:hypothetical protein